MDIYVDGSCGVSSRGTITGGIGICFRLEYIKDLSITIYWKNTTPIIIQNLEAVAVCITLILTENIDNVNIYSDCEQTVSCLTDLREYYQSRNWRNAKKKPIASSAILKECISIMEARNEKGCTANIKRVIGHSGIVGNSIADKLAYQGMCNVSKDKAINSITLTIITTVCNLVANSHDLQSVKQFLTALFSNKQGKATVLDTSMDDDEWGSFGQISTKASKKKKKSYAVTFDEPAESVECAEFLPESVVEQENVYSVNADTFNEGMNAYGTPPPPGMDESPAISKSIEDMDEHDTMEYINNHDNYLFFPCIRCSSTIVSMYPESKSDEGMKNLGTLTMSTIAFTICKTCTVDAIGSSEYTDITKESQRQVISFESIKLSPNIFDDSKISKCVEFISESKPSILTSSTNVVKYISILVIGRSLNNKCRLSSIDLDKKEILPYLQFGFLF